MASGAPQLLRKPQAATAARPVENAETSASLGASPAPAQEGSQQAPADPHCLLDAAAWELRPAAVASQLSARNADFAVVGVLGGQGLGKSRLLNALLGLDAAGLDALPQPSGVPPPAFPTSGAAAAAVGLQHCTRGVQLRASGDRLVGLDTQPLFSASVLEEMARWEAPPPALAAPAVAAASDAKAAAVPLEGAQELAQLQLAVLLLAACSRVLVLCDGLCDRRTWELALTAEMLARGVPDPSLPPAPAAGAAAGGATAGVPSSASQQASASSAASAAARPRQAPAAEHLAEVVFVHVQPPGAAPPTAAQLQALEARLDAFFASSRLRQAGPLRMREHLPGGSGGGGSGGSSSSSQGVSYWVLPAPQPSSSSGGGGSGGEDASGGWGGAVAVLVAALLSRPAPPFARRCSELGWLRGVAGDTWRAVRKSPSLAAFYSRLARTQLKGAAGWALAR